MKQRHKNTQLLLNGKSIAVGAAAILATALSTQAATITQTVAGAFGSNWNSAIWGSPAAAPTTGNDYVTASGLFASGSTGLGANVTGRIRESGTTFGGDSVTISSATEILMKQNNGSTSNGDVIMNGGVIRLSPDNAGSAILAGTLNITSSSVLGVVQHVAAGTTLTISSTVTGSGDMRLAAANTSNSTVTNHAIVFSGNLTGYSGTIDVGGGNQALTLNLAQAYNLPDLTLTYGNHSSADILNLTHNIAIGAFSFGATQLDVGTYTAAQLNSLFGSGSQFTGANTLTVIPEPGTALLGLFGMLALLRRRR